MTRQEFLDTLRRALNRELSAAQVEENIAYYDNYIREQMAKGQTEAQVIARLGDPRLIARTILQVDDNRETARSSVFDTDETVYMEETGRDGYFSDQDFDGELREERGRSRFPHIHFFQIKGWMAALVLILALILVLALVLALAGIAMAVLWKLLPFLLILWLVLWVAAWLYRRFW